MRAPFASVVEVIAPVRLGRAFRWLLSATVITNVGDGVALAAGPLLVASQTRDPLLVSMALLAQTLPALLFGVVAGAVADRYDRRRVVLAVDLGRAAVLAALAATILTGTVDIAVTLAALFVLGGAGSPASPTRPRSANTPSRRRPEAGTCASTRGTGVITDSAPWGGAGAVGPCVTYART